MAQQPSRGQQQQAFGANQVLQDLLLAGHLLRCATQALPVFTPHILQLLPACHARRVVQTQRTSHWSTAWMTIH